MSNEAVSDQSPAEKTTHERLADALKGFDHRELNWLVGLIRDGAREGIDKLELEILRHERFDRPDKLERATSVLDFHRRALVLCDVLKEFLIENDPSVEAIGEYLRQKHGRQKQKAKSVQSKVV